MANIKKITAGASTYDVEALHFITGSLDTPAQWKSYIDNLVGQGLQIVIDSQHATKREPATTASASTMGKLYMVTMTDQLVGTYTEFITIDKGESASPRYVWEKIGTTEVDLSNYLKKGIQYDNAALTKGAHTHTVSGSVTVPTVSSSAAKLKISTTNAATSAKSTANAITGFGTHTTASAITGFGDHTTDTFVKSYPGTTSKLVKASVVPAVDNGKASKATAGTDKSFATNGIKSASLTGTTTFNTDAIKAASLNVSTTTSTGAEAIVTAVGETTLTGTKTFNTDAIKSATCSQSFLTSGIASVSANTTGSDFMREATVSNDGVLSFNFGGISTTAATPTAVSISTTAAGTGTVGISSGAVTTKYAKVNTTAAGTASVGISTAASDTDTITPYTFQDVDVAKVGTAVSVATGALSAEGTGASVMTGLGTATTASSITALGTPTTAAAITALGTPTTAAAITELNTASVVNGIAPDPDGTIGYVSSVSVGTTSASLANGSAASAGDHTHHVLVSVPTT